MNFSRVLNPDQPKSQPVVARTPQGIPSTRAHVETPLASMLVTVGTVMLIPTVLISLWPVPAKWLILGIITWVVMNAAWFWYSNAFMRTIWKIEELTNTDLTNDKIRGAPYGAFIPDGKTKAAPQLSAEQILSKRFSEFLDTAYRIGSAAYPKMVEQGWRNKDEVKRFRDMAIKAGILMEHPNGTVEAIVTRERARQLESQVRWNAQEGVY